MRRSETYSASIFSYSSSVRPLSSIARLGKNKEDVLGQRVSFVEKVNSSNPRMGPLAM
jgi:hypothetical protein